MNLRNTLEWFFDWWRCRRNPDKDKTVYRAIYVWNNTPVHTFKYNFTVLDRVAKPIKFDLKPLHK